MMRKLLEKRHHLFFYLLNKFHSLAGDGKPIEKCGLSTLVKGQRQVSANGTEVVTQNKLAKSKNISSKQAVSMVPLSGSV